MRINVLKKGYKIKLHKDILELTEDMRLDNVSLKEWLQEENDKKGLEINGIITRADNCEIDWDRFSNDFLDFIESKGMLFGGGVNYKNPYKE